jgi:hypothetical protein
VLPVRPEELAYLELCAAVWEAGWRLWWERCMTYSGIDL